MRQAAAVLLCVLTLVITSVPGRSQVASTGANWAPNVTAVASPAAPNSAQPQLSGLGDRVVLSWVERSGDSATLRFAERTDSGWTEARTVASGENWFVNWADVLVGVGHASPQRSRTEHGFASLFPMPGQGLGVV